MCAEPLKSWYELCKSSFNVIEFVLRRYQNVRFNKMSSEWQEGPRCVSCHSITHGQHKHDFKKKIA